LQPYPYAAGRWRIRPYTCADQLKCSNSQTTSSGKVTCTSEHLSWSGSADPKVHIEQARCSQYKPSDILEIGPLNQTDRIHEDEDDQDWADPGQPSGGKSHPGDDNNDDNSKGEEVTQGGGKGTRKGKETQDGKGKGQETEDAKGKRQWNGKGQGEGKGIVEQTPGGDNISRTMVLQLQQDMSEPDFNTEG
jgi:hypothetical protein